MSLSRCLSLLCLLVNVNLYAYERAYVVAVSSGFSEDNQQTYGISSYETLGKGKWGIYGEMLFSYQHDTLSYCVENCDYIDLKDRRLNFTVGGSYGLTDRLYGLAGVGARIRGISTAPFNNSDVCDPEEEDKPAHLPSSINRSDGSQYCGTRNELGIVAQVGLLYVTPVGLSFSGTIDTDKTATLSVGYQF